MDVGAGAELSYILGHYNLGELVWYEQDQRGYINTSFAIQTEKDGKRKKYFLRRYKKGVRQEELLFEHSLINHLSAKNFTIIARVYETRQGSTYVYVAGENEGQNGVYYAIFDFLGGEDRYTWIAPSCTPTEIASSAEVLAEFHRLARDLSTSGRRSEPRILELLPQIEGNLSDCLQHPKGSVFDEYLIENAETIFRAIEQTKAALLRHPCGSMIDLVIHCDFHPGNLKFEGEQVVGLFDFDWSKIDLRCYDVAHAIWYFFACWDADRDGEIRLDDCEIFLATYQDVLLKKPGLEPMTHIELSCLPDMIAAANLYVLNWTILDYLHKEVDPEAYLVFLKHGVNTIRWLGNEPNRIRLEEILEGVRNPDV